MNFNPGLFFETLPIMGKGMLGILAVTSIIVLVIYLLNKFTKAE